MEVKIHKNKITISHTLKSNETYRVQKGNSIQSVTILKKPQVVSGFSNECEDHLGILTIDYDGVDEKVALEDYELIQKKFKLPQGYLFKTTKGYHVICLKKFLNSKIYEILLHTRCDNNYKDMPLRNPFRNYVLRISTKKGGKNIKFLKTIGRAINGNYEISSAHLTLLRKLYPSIYAQRYEKEDGFKVIKHQIYETK